jgi:hypothetical protein
VQFELEKEIGTLATQYARGAMRRLTGGTK